MDVFNADKRELFAPDGAEINLRMGRQECLLRSFESGIAYGVFVNNTGCVTVVSGNSGRARFYPVETLVRTAIEDDIDEPRPENT